MSLDKEFKRLKDDVSRSKQAAEELVERIQSEIDFARSFVTLFPEKKSEWESLISKAAEVVSGAASIDGKLDLVTAVAQAESILAPIGKVAKEYTIHCCGHAHIDMNWMWGWPETVNVTHDTFMTVEKLMEEFPDFKFSQSQASTYQAMEKYCPEMFEMLKQKVADGSWEVTASMWVEGEKNYVSGESLCRHLLYTREYFKEKLGLEPEQVKIDWSPDTFGHAHTLPSILTRGGVTRYYHMRTGPGPILYTWRSPDGSEITVFNDQDVCGYGGPIHAGVGVSLVNCLKDYAGLKDFLYVYGVGDHGGGPTRKDLRKGVEMQSWPIYPVVAFSTTDKFFTAVEASDVKLPVIDKDLNFIFEGCYTSQSTVKYANRVNELVLPEAETLALIASTATGMEYPIDQFTTAWQNALFCHFHDILPGSGVRATYAYANGLFQEILALTSSVKNRALRRLASRVDTASAVGESGLDLALDNGLGAGVGDTGVAATSFAVGASIFTNTLSATKAGTTTRGAGAPGAEPVLVYNSRPWARTETVIAKVWNKPLEDDKVVVKDASGDKVKGQIVDKGSYWGHDYAAVAFKATDIPALGYRAYAIDSEVSPVEGKGCSAAGLFGNIYGMMSGNPAGRGYMENELIKVGIDFSSGAVFSIMDKETGAEYVKPGELLGLMEVWQESPHGMTSWVIAHAPVVTKLTSGGRVFPVADGPGRVSIRTDHVYNSSALSMEIGLNAGSKQIDFKLRTRWTEIGTPETGVPMLRVAFPANVNGGKATYEIPFGSQQHPQGAQEIPALKWADISGDTQGLTMTNDCKNGYSCNEDVLRLTILRSSYDPDPIPEVGDHEINMAVIPHAGACDIVAATRFGENFNNPLAVISATLQKGDMPSEQSFAEALTPNIFISTIKKAEHSGAAVIRMFETEGKDTEAKIRLCGISACGSTAVETDVLERPLDTNTATYECGVLTVKVPAYGQTTVKIG